MFVLTVRALVYYRCLFCIYYVADDRDNGEDIIIRWRRIGIMVRDNGEGIIIIASFKCIA
jgi:hypothetical protein